MGRPQLHSELREYSLTRFDYSDTVDRGLLVRQIVNDTLPAEPEPGSRRPPPIAGGPE